MATFGPLQCQTYPPSNLTGPCLIDHCATDSVQGGGCGGEVALCTAGSTHYFEYFDRDQTNPIICEYLCTADCIECPYGTEIQSDTCGIYPLAGKIDGEGIKWSLYDATSTVMLSVYSGTHSDGSSFTIFSVDMEDTASTQPFVYFEDRATAEGANSPISTSSSGTGPMMLTTSTSAARTATPGSDGNSATSQATATIGTATITTAAAASSTGSGGAAGSAVGDGRKLTSESAIRSTSVAILAILVSHLCFY